MSPRSPETVPSLARLLADLPLDRLRKLAGVWGAGEAGGSAAIYRRMTTSEVARAMRDGLSAEDRLLFDTLIISRVADHDDLRRRLPFSEDELERRLAGLESQGLIWRRVTSSEGGRSRRGWFIASDLAGSLAERAPRPGPVRAASTPPVPEALAEEPALVRPFGQIVRLISLLGDEATDIRSGASALEACALSYGAALGVWTEALRPGPRYEAWQRLDDSRRVRALARLWLVDETGPSPVSETIRQAVWETLSTLADQKWYGLDQVARRVAWEAGRTGAGGRILAREQFETALSTLALLGIIRLAVDRRERPSALSVTTWGAEALS